MNLRGVALSFRQHTFGLGFFWFVMLAASAAVASNFSYAYRKVAEP